MTLPSNKNRLTAFTRLPQPFKLLCDKILNHYRVSMNLIVNVHKGVRKLGFEWATRQAWKCGMKAT